MRLGQLGNTELPSWVHRYLRLLRSGLTVSDATAEIGIARNLPWGLRAFFPGFEGDEREARDEGEVQREIARQEKEEERLLAMAKTHKRTNHRGNVQPLCADLRGKKIHNHWKEVNCENCWSSRIPTKADRCKWLGCVALAAHFVHRMGFCNVHAADIKAGKCPGGSFEIVTVAHDGYDRMLAAMAGEE